MTSIRNLWAPWRQEYIEYLSEGASGCFICQYRDDQDHDKDNFVLWRTDRCLALLNRFPYTGGHALVAPLKHVGDLTDLDAPTMLEITELLRDLKQVMADALGAEGFNIGINLGRSAGAGLPDHLHAHIVPRWKGDTNFISVFGDVRVVPISLARIYDQMLASADRLKLPKLSPYLRERG